MILHIFLTMVWSGLATALPLPINPMMIYFYSTLTIYNPIITISIAVIVDTIVGYLVYKLFLNFNYTKFNIYTKPLLRLGYRGNFTHTYINTTVVGILNDKKTQRYINKYGGIVLFISASTPLPFTAVLYASGVVKYSKPQVLIPIVFLGRIINYSFMYLLGLGVINL